MKSVSFFSAVDFGEGPKSWQQSALEVADRYFCLGDRRALSFQEICRRGAGGLSFLKAVLPLFL